MIETARGRDRQKHNKKAKGRKHALLNATRVGPARYDDPNE